MKKLLSFALAAVMLLAIIPFSVAAETYSGTCGADGDNLTWTLDTATGVLTISGTGKMKNYSSENAPWYSDRSYIKSVIIKDGVTTIGANAFCGYTGLSSVTIPNSITYIGDSAFVECSGLTSIEIPDSVKQIGDYAFSKCSGLTNVKIGSSVKQIGDYAFSKCSGLTSIEIPDSVEDIGECAFGGSGLTSIVIPDSVTVIGWAAFCYCFELTDIYFEREAVTTLWNNWKDDCDATVHWNYKTAVIESVTENAFPSGTEINVKKVDDEDKLSVFEIITENGINKENAELFDIELIYGGEVIQPNGNVKVSITAPEGINVEQVKVYHVSDDGTLTDMNAAYEDGKFVFFTDHFSYYLIAEVLVGFETKTIALGDINMDGMVNQYDYILAKRAHFNTIELTDAQKLAGDMDENGKNNQYDYILVKRIHFKNYSTDKTVEIVVE